MVTGDTFSSDYFLAVGNLDATPTTTSYSYDLFNFETLDWFLFWMGTVVLILELVSAVYEEINPVLIYNRVVNVVFRILVDCGAYVSNFHRGKRESQPL